MGKLIDNLETAGDERLIALVTQGSLQESKRAFEIIYKRYHRDVWRFIRSRVNAKTDADEIFGDVWVVVAEKIYDFEWRGISIKSWLFKIAENKIREFLRQPFSFSYEELEENRNPELHDALHNGPPQSGLAETEPFSDASSEVKKEAQRRLHQEISKLPAKQLKIIKLKYFEGIDSLKEIARKLGMNENTVRVYKMRAEKKIGESEALSELYK